MGKYMIAREVYLEALDSDDNCDSSYYQEFLEKKLGVKNLFNLEKINDK